MFTVQYYDALKRTSKAKNVNGAETAETQYKAQDDKPCIHIPHRQPTSSRS